MIIRESSRKEVEERLNSMGDYVRIDYLSELLKSNLNYDTRRFALLKLASLYKNKGMLAEAAKLVRNAAEINTTYDSMMKDYIKAMQLFIQAGSFDDADISMNKAVASANTEAQRKVIKTQRKDEIMTQAQVFMKNDKRKHALQAYEKLISLPEMSPQEKREAQEKLLGLYEKLGKVREFYSLKNGM